MDNELATEPREIQEELSSLPFPRAWWARALYGLFVLVMPILAFWATELFLPEWQDGRLSSYLILLLSPPASWGFFPLLAFSIISYILLLINFARYSQEVVIRLGIYAGILLALQFSILFGLYTFDESPFALILVVVWLLPILVSRVYPWAITKWGRERAIIVIMILVIFIFIALVVITTQLFTPLLLLLAALTIASPFWCFLLFLKAAIILLRSHETKFSASHGLALTASLSVYIVAWRFSILKMYELYNALPPQPPPDCYIATAGAQGHPEFVGSEIVWRSDATSLRVNPQLQILKCAELALMAIVPRFHKLLRNFYDGIGKSLARKIHNAYVADLAYLLLKPVEWLARIALKSVLPEIDLIAQKIYRT